jgi:hypothetical protein
MKHGQDGKKSVIYYYESEWKSYLVYSMPILHRLGAKMPWSFLILINFGETDSSG